ncbi:hypothetical protein BGZ49_002485 [Haplosporangium sp. Z 27]|nr:hypothetical protein BGZ49_002485 [Haplosporangium sp. Z 27]
MKTYSSKKAILAVAAIVALIASTSISTTEAAPLAHHYNVDNMVVDFGSDSQDRRQAAAIINSASHLNKRAAPIIVPHDTTTTAPKATQPATQTSHAGTTANPAKTTTKDSTKPTATSANTPAHTSSASHPAASNSGASGTVDPSNTSSGSVPSSTVPAGSGQNNVPPGVSEKVFIGLGTVGGLFIFALGGVAFCRHRKKKNLATALLQQTAQFNNNNPYAKLPEPAATPKESLPMTPTKPLGTYNVVATYTPALADEIEIGMNDSVTILQEFDDGWCMGVNNSRGGAKGVFPRHCVEMGPYEGSQHGAPGGPHYPPSPSFKATANKRMSSIAPQNGGWNDANYPPQPNPQYPGPNQGGFYNGY